MCSKGIADPENHEWSEDLLRRLRRSLEQYETYRQQVSQQRHTNAELERWDTKLGKNYVKMRLSTNHIGCMERPIYEKQKIKHTAGHPLPVTQHLDHHLAVKIVKSVNNRESLGGNFR